MAQRISHVRHLTETVFAEDGSITRSIDRVDYRVEDADTGLSDWVEMTDVDIDPTRRVSAQRDKIEADARAAHGIAAR